MKETIKKLKKKYPFETLIIINILHWLKSLLYHTNIKFLWFLKSTNVERYVSKSQGNPILSG